MNMKDALKFGLKAFFGGCLGCLGVISVILILVVIFGVIFGPQVAGGISTFLQSIPGIFSQSLSSFSGGMLGNSTNIEPVPPMDVYLTIGNKSDAKHITSFSTTQSKQVYFWVQVPKDTAISFSLLITLPDKSQTQFGPEFKSDVTGKPVNCGQFGDMIPIAGNYKLDVIPKGNSTSASSIEFKVTK
jgi:hypothetical protein